MILLQFWFEFCIFYVIILKSDSNQIRIVKEEKKRKDREKDREKEIKRWKIT
jgi:hypothetical protein